MATDIKQTTLGMDRVRIGFNPSGDSRVNALKQATADLIDECERMKDGGGERARCAALAQTHYETAAMWAVKAATAG